VKAIAIFDGRGNAGTGARAAVLYLGDDRHERAEKLPATTNIVAEHLAIQLAMMARRQRYIRALPRASTRRGNSRGRVAGPASGQRRRQHH